jgi:hypothetical protein
MQLSFLINLNITPNLKRNRKGTTVQSFFNSHSVVATQWHILYSGGARNLLEYCQLIFNIIKFKLSSFISGNKRN